MFGLLAQIHIAKSFEAASIIQRKKPCTQRAQGSSFVISEFRSWTYERTNFFRNQAHVPNNAEPNSIRLLGSGVGEVCGDVCGLVLLWTINPVFVNCVEKILPLSQPVAAQVAASPKAIMNVPTGRLLLKSSAELPLKAVVLIENT